jgi:integrase
MRIIHEMKGLTGLEKILQGDKIKELMPHQLTESIQKTDSICKNAATVILLTGCRPAEASKYNIERIKSKHGVRYQLTWRLRKKRNRTVIRIMDLSEEYEYLFPAIHCGLRQLTRFFQKAIEMTPRAYRHWMALDMSAKGFELDDIREALGHASIRTTRIYARIDSPLDRWIKGKVNLQY